MSLVTKMWHACFVTQSNLSLQDLVAGNARHLWQVFNSHKITLRLLFSYALLLTCDGIGFHYILQDRLLVTERTCPHLHSNEKMNFFSIYSFRLTYFCYVAKPVSIEKGLIRSLWRVCDKAAAGGRISVFTRLRMRINCASLSYHRIPKIILWTRKAFISWSKSPESSRCTIYEGVWYCVRKQFQAFTGVMGE